MNYGGNQISLNSGNREKPSGTTSEAILGISNVAGIGLDLLSIKQFAKSAKICFSIKSDEHRFLFRQSNAAVPRSPITREKTAAS